MRIVVKAKPSAREEKVELKTQEPLLFDSREYELPIYVVSVKEPPENGKANKAILEALSTYFSVPLSHVVLISGKSSRTKQIEIKG